MVCIYKKKQGAGQKPALFVENVKKMLKLWGEFVKYTIYSVLYKLENIADLQ